MNSYIINNIMETIMGLGFFAAIFLSFYFYLRFRNKERMALIEKGVDVSEIFKSRDFSFKDFSFKFPWFRLGVLVLGIGIGVFVAYLLIIYGPLPQNRRQNMIEEFSIIFSLLIFGGLGIIIGHIIERSGHKKNG